jgi:hypothetical protein
MDDFNDKSIYPVDKSGHLIQPKVPCYKDKAFICSVRHSPDSTFECAREPGWCRLKKKP